MQGMQRHSTRAGESAWQIGHGGYSAFIPKPLPPDPPLIWDDELARLLSLAERALGRLDGESDILPNPDLFVAMYVNKEAVQSSQIEGTQASLTDIIAFEAAAAEPENPQDVEEVVNYVAALNYGLSRLDTLPISNRLIREMHQRLLSGVRGSDKDPGEFRRVQNLIGARGDTLKTARYVPPLPDEMQQALKELERFINSDDRLPPLITIGLVHAQFEAIHPFLDGNGRIGRLLITLYLCERQILRRPLLYLSYYINANRPEYYSVLQRIRDDGDWEAWLKFFLRGVYSVAQEATATARAIVALRERHRKLIMETLPRAAGRGLHLLEYLYEHPITTARLVTHYEQVTPRAANQLIARFEQMGILQETTHRGRNRRFTYHDYLALFEGEVEQ
ncbi:MAG TPA: Fic family protein [Ktedonobacterales bacterium]|jgi:Fic family protein|nr:Fic family protein [Ktedonobacterales bacterium]